jgi:magnesium-transporting ATPase (P-type)
MKKIKQDVFTKIMMIFMGVFFILFVISYALFKYFLLNTLSQTSLNPEVIISQYNTIWIEISILATLLFIAMLYILRKLNAKLEEDINAIDTYVKEISEHKNYDAVIKIKHYLEFLEIAVVFKNIAKRLKQKEKKSSKK